MTTEYLYLNSRDELLRLDISQIVYFRADGNYTNIILANKLRCVVCMNLTQMQNMLSAQLKEKASNFARIGKSYIINMNYICAIQILKQILILSDQRTFVFSLAISKEALKTLRNILINP